MREGTKVKVSKVGSLRTVVVLHGDKNYFLIEDVFLVLVFTKISILKPPSEEGTRHKVHVGCRKLW